jgi:hypothetical protein
MAHPPTKGACGALLGQRRPILAGSRYRNGRKTVYKAFVGLIFSAELPRQRSRKTYINQCESRFFLDKMGKCPEMLANLRRC